MKNSLALFETVGLVIAPFLVKLRSSFRKGVSVADCSNVMPSFSCLMSSALMSSYLFFNCHHCFGRLRASVKPGRMIMS